MKHAPLPRIRRPHGFTLVEALVTVGLLAIFIPIAVQALSRGMLYMRQASSRNQVTQELNTCMTTMREFLRLGKGTSVVIDTPAGAPPYSRITFNRASDNVQYKFYWENGNVYMRVGTTREPALLASNVTSLTFLHPDTSDASQISVSMRFVAQVDSKHTVSAALTEQLVQMEQS